MLEVASEATDDALVLVAGGGTAGHVLPGLAIVDALVNRGISRSSVLWIGSERGQEATLVPAAAVRTELLPGRGIQRRLTRENIGAVLGLIRAFVSAIALVRKANPRVVVCLGGYASLAAALAAVLWRIPVVVAEQNARAGAANRLIGRFATVCAVPFEETDLPRKVVTGNPIRSEILLAASSGDRSEARSKLSIPADAVMIAVFAGSLGSRRINEAVTGLVSAWSDRSNVVIYHVLGRRDFAELSRPEANRPEAKGSLTYRAVEYEERMDRVLLAADFAICRSGGTTVAELAAIGVPSILVPLPIAPRDHQRFNAGPLVRAGGAVIVDDAECTTERLREILTPILDDPSIAAAMADHARSVGRIDAADAVAGIVERFALNGSRR
jgi:undecaprenyldiphospho-muramoylpentapeptide beta-N-acetylglucosaminyltransferase